MSDLHNPLFEEEKEFLERKKLEYERALRGDVDHLREQSVKVGRVALVGAGLAGGIWLISKAFGGKKRKRPSQNGESGHDPNDFGGDEFEGDDFGAEQEFGDEYYTAGNGQRYKSVRHPKSAADSANAFMAHNGSPEQAHEADDLGFGSKAVSQADQAAGFPTGTNPFEPSPFNPQEFEDDPFRDMPYDDSRRLPASHAFDHAPRSVENPWNERSRMVGSVLQAFLKSDTGKVLVAQVAAVALAMVTKKVSEFFPADKNPDLATAPGYAPAETGSAPAVSLASPDSPDASTHTSSI